ncbi:MAG: FAD-dependent thymidylate synthase [Candidatus Pacearchaeota archaeon]
MEWEKEGLKVRLLGYWPRYENKNSALKFNLGDFLGADAIVSFLQKAVSQSVSFSEGLETEVRRTFEKGELEDAIKKKLASSVLRGHSLDGTAGIVLGIEGSKFIDSALTGLVNSRSFTTSGRRALIEDILVPNVLEKPGNEMLKERYIETSHKSLQTYKKIFEAFGEKQGPQIASKMMAYNSSGNLYIVLPVSAIITLSNELEHQKNEGETFFPREIENLVDIIEKEIVKEAGMKRIYDARKAALRDTYLHWNVFKAPKINFANMAANAFYYPKDPKIIYCHISDNSLKGHIQNLKNKLESTYSLKDPEKIERAARENLLVFHEMVDMYNDAVSVQTISSLSFRVWGEQKRHATLKQCVESVYLAAERAYNVTSLAVSNAESLKRQLEQVIMIPPPLKQQGQEELLKEYLKASAEQIMLMRYLTENGIERKDAIYILPRCIRLRTVETYDLYNLTLGELSLRLCTTCEPERLATSEIKEGLIKEKLPELSPIIGPKCILGYCSEPTHCSKILKFNPDYSKEIHQEIRNILMHKANL